MGDENAELESNGSYVYANRYTDRNGAQVVMLIRASYCPGVICNIISEPVLVYQEKCSITFGGDGRVITMADGKRLCLSMTSNGLGWLKSDPITDDVTVLDNGAADEAAERKLASKAKTIAEARDAASAPESQRATIRSQ